MEDLQALLQENVGALIAAFLVIIVLSYVVQLLSSTPTLPPALVKTEFREFPLIHREDVSHNTRLFRFGLTDPKQGLGLPVGKHISVLAVSDDGKEIRRPYTPTTGVGTKGYFDLVVKVYPEGKMSQHMDKLVIGQTLKFRGPMGRFAYTSNMKAFIGMVCGGTGITPMYQVMKAVLEDPNDTTKLALIFGNITEDDILLRDELATLEERYASRLEVTYILDRPPHGWKGGKGYVTPEMIAEKFGPPSQDKLVLRCGPPGLNKAVAGHLAKLGFAPDQQFEF